MAIKLASSWWRKEAVFAVASTLIEPLFWSNWIDCNPFVKAVVFGEIYAGSRTWDINSSTLSAINSTIIYVTIPAGSGLDLNLIPIEIEQFYAGATKWCTAGQ
jgi:hypothetical protein